MVDVYLLLASVIYTPHYENMYFYYISRSAMVKNSSVRFDFNGSRSQMEGLQNGLCISVAILFSMSYTNNLLL